MASSRRRVPIPRDPAWMQIEMSDPALRVDWRDTPEVRLSHVGASEISEHDDPARHLPAAERREPVVDLLELVRAAHQLIDLQPAVQVENDQLREFDVRT